MSPKMLQSILPHLQNPCNFVKQFHSEGSRHYDTHQHITKLSLRIDAILSNHDPAAVGKILNDDGYILIPSHQIIVRTNIQKKQCCKKLLNVKIKLSRITWMVFLPNLEN